MIAKICCAATVATIFAATSAGAVVVDIDGIANATPGTAVQVLLAAGIYNVTPIIGTYTAFSRFASVSGCDGNGQNCRTGWEHSYFVTIGNMSTGFGDGNGAGGIGPISPGAGYYASAAQAFADGATPTVIALAAPTLVGFSVFDDALGDNSGGISLDVSPVGGGVPEPATWSLLVGGFAMVGFAARRRRTVVAA